MPARWPGLALHFESHAPRRAQREKTSPSRIDLIAKHNFISACIPPRVIPLRGRSTEGPEPIFSKWPLWPENEGGRLDFPQPIRNPLNCIFRANKFYGKLLCFKWIKFWKKSKENAAQLPEKSLKRHSTPRFSDMIIFEQITLSQSEVGLLTHRNDLKSVGICFIF